MKKYIPTANSWFSGAGLMDIGLMQGGVRINQSVDLDPRATSCMAINPHYFGHRGHQIITGDITQMTALDQPDADMEIFTYPCKKYSTIADIHGARTGEELFLHALRMIALRRKKLKMYVIENVPGMKAFPVVMEAMTKLPGYYVKIFCPIDAAIWLPQRRERLIVIATAKPFNIEAPVARRRVRMKDIIEKNPVYDMPDYVINRIRGNYRDLPIIVDPNDPDAMAPTCVAHYSKDLGTRLVKDRKAKYGVRPFSIREYARLQGVPDDYHFPEERSSYMLIGNGVAVPVGRWIGQQAVKYFNQ
jgi:DNA (cytosine-5)-methyltransferase 1